jgi:hypothetical protein
MDGAQMKKMKMSPRVQHSNDRKTTAAALTTHLGEGEEEDIPIHPSYHNIFPFSSHSPLFSFGFFWLVFAFCHSSEFLVAQISILLECLENGIIFLFVNKCKWP